MVLIAVSFTAPIDSPTLTRAHLWTGLQRKIRHAEEFVPVIKSCTVLSEESGVVERKVVFNDGMHAKEAKEWVRGVDGEWVDFEQENGTHIRNIISEGANGELYMSYTFEFSLPDVQEGSEEAAKEKAKFRAMAKKAVESSIDTIKAMVEDGRISA